MFSKHNTRPLRGRNGQTKTFLLFLIISFYAVYRTVIAFLYPISAQETVVECSNIVVCAVADVFNFIGIHIFGIAGQPILTACLFVPLSIALTFLIVTSSPSMSGGS